MYSQQKEGRGPFFDNIMVASENPCIDASGLCMIMTQLTISGNMKSPDSPLIIIMASMMFRQHSPNCGVWSKI